MSIEEKLTGYNPFYQKVKHSLWVFAATAVAIRGRGLKLIRTPYGKFATENKYSLTHFFPMYEKVVKRAVSALPQDGFFVDIGANIGLYTVMAAQRNCDVISIEPGDLAFRLLNENIRKNGCESRVKAFNIAAWKTWDTVKLTKEKNSAFRTVGNSGDETHAVPMDFFLIPSNRRADLIKIDVEDTEAEVLQGMVKYLARYQSPVIFEAHSQADVERSMSVLRPLGYRSKRLDALNWLASAS